MSSCGREPGSEESEDCLSAATGAEASVDENADLSKLEPLEFERDVETEDLLASQIRSDPMDAYDVDVSEEGRVIKEFLEKIALEEAKQSG
uniref:Uncharacterized protein n=1 Tax=Tetraselmis sp. GSL018 TaxID=582737 RepID=A0A061RUI5_9CHLO|eukprot:CAMPEP_0177619912 /NCGR_PEP_ID=MMETSP0419_2-20121207/26563_1 /TAXON_ID=582737 /ORGANISM="Tetraselmis sp., Strain GSL018" /LENGTH=90 /DNA_ID=CAMNT_0019119311 /DNA_START=484 /DNA_END=756 /DNA_ORIENTATION=-